MGHDRESECGDLEDVERRVSALEFGLEMKDSDRLQFYSDYLVRGRQDAMQDKAVLTQITYLKVVVFAALFSLMRNPTATLGIGVLPLVLFSLDYLHRTRFNEIFDRWKHLSEVVVPRIKELSGENTRFLEESINERRESGEYHVSEGVVRMLMSLLATLSTVPICGSYLAWSLSLSNAQGAGIAVVWCILLIVLYCLLFLLREGYRKTHVLPWVIPVALFAYVVVLVFFGEPIVNVYQEGLRLGEE